MSIVIGCHRPGMRWVVIGVTDARQIEKGRQNVHRRGEGVAHCARSLLRESGVPHDKRNSDTTFRSVMLIQSIRSG